MEMLQDPILDKIKVQLVKEFHPTRLFLYGSRANGTHREDSYYDFVMVLPEFDRKNRFELMQRVSTRLWAELNVEVQVWAYSQEEFELRKDDFSSIPETAMNTGMEIALG